MRKEAVIRGVLLMIVGSIIYGFGYADIMYYLTDLDITVDYMIMTVGGIISFAGFIYLVYGLIAKGPMPPPAATYYPTPAPTYAPTPQPQPQAQVPRCPTCNQPLELIQQYNRWYCRTCQKYV